MTSSHHHSHIGRDYISSVAVFESDSMALRKDYVKYYLGHQKAIVEAKKTMDTFNHKVFSRKTGLRDRLAFNHRRNPPREVRALEIARDNALLVERLTEISFKVPSATTTQIAEHNKRIHRRLSYGTTSLNDRMREHERARIEEENLNLANRLLAGTSPYSAKNFKEHVARHEYFVKSKSRARAIHMKTVTPGKEAVNTSNMTTSRGAAGAGMSPRRAEQQRPATQPQASSSSSSHPYSHHHPSSTSSHFTTSLRNNTEAEIQASDEYARALRQYANQQNSLGYGWPMLPPIAAGTSSSSHHTSTKGSPAMSKSASSFIPVPPPNPHITDSDLLQGESEPWLESHSNDHAYLKEIHTHRPKVRQSHTINPREALRLPPQQNSTASNGIPLIEEQAKLLLQQAHAEYGEDDLVIPRTKLIPETGAYEIEWVEMKQQAKQEELPLEQRRAKEEQQQQQMDATRTQTNEIEEESGAKEPTEEKQSD